MAKINKRTTCTLDGFEVQGCPIDWADPVILFSEDKQVAVVGYLSHDTDPLNPLEEYDGEDHLYHHPRSKFCSYGPSNYYNVLGLDQYGEPDEDLQADPDAVLLDIYEHGGVAYSVSGQGTQCRWDTSSGAAVWVPDDACRERIDDLEEIFRRSTLAELRAVMAVADVEGNIIAEFQKDDWAGIWGLLKGRCTVQCVEREPAVARAMACEYLAKQFCEVWNQYISGDCYCVHVESFAQAANGEWGSTGEECSGGHLGLDNALQCMSDEAKATLEWLSKSES